MRVTHIKMANLRAIGAAEFKFQPGFNLVAGINGVGKTTVLLALAACLSNVVKHANRLRSKSIGLSNVDIRAGTAALDVQCGFEYGHGQEPFGYIFHKSRESAVPRRDSVGQPRKQTFDTPDIGDFDGTPPPPSTGSEPGGRPLAILFSTNRSVPSNQAPGKSAAAGGVTAAFSGALANNRELLLTEFKAWMKVQEEISSERPIAKRVLGAFGDALTRFLPDYSYLHLADENDDTGELLLIRGGTAALPIQQLSDGERGVLAIVLDLTRRLAQANPTMENPAAEAEAVVLIDELELHLHPAWQRRIVHDLSRTFPKCQFIATTHSPQIVGEVPHDRVQIISHGEVFSPSRSFGLDSSEVLDEVMDTAPRTAKAHALLARISKVIGRDQYDDAKVLLSKLEDMVGENNSEVIRIKTLLDFLGEDS